MKVRKIKIKDIDRIKIRLIFLNIVSNREIGVEEACTMCGIAIPTGYLWIRKWNENGYEGLKDKEEGKRGKPPKLSEEGIERLKELLKDKPYWTTKQVRIIIKEKLGVEYSEDQVVRILRDKIGMKFSKPYPKDYPGLCSSQVCRRCKAEGMQTYYGTSNARQRSKFGEIASPLWLQMPNVSAVGTCHYLVHNLG